MNRVVVTGLGAVTPIGNNVATYWEHLKGGVHGFAPITRFDATATGITLAAEVKGFDPNETMDRKEHKRMTCFRNMQLQHPLKRCSRQGLIWHN